MIEREREREQIRRKIKRLEKKTNRTPEEEQELNDLKEKLTQLEKEHNNQSPNNWIKPVLIGGGIVTIALLLIYLLTRKNNR